MTTIHIKRQSFLLVAITLMLGINGAFASSTGRNAGTPPAQEILFTSGSWMEIAAEAKQQGKYIFVDAYTTWCAPCRQLKNVTFKDKEAAAYFNENFINYSVDMEKGEGVELAEKWEVMAYPTLLFFTPEGKMIMKQLGYVDGEQLIMAGRQALSRK